MNTPTTSNTLYRFRSIEALLDKYQELEKQAIYFASPDELNDPMEGFRDIVWRGDRIVWTNFFKHFIYCLHESYSQLIRTRDSKKLDVDNIPILGCWDKIPSSEARKLFNAAWHRFLNLPNIPEIIEALANTNRKIRYRELECYLRAIQYGFLPQILGSSFASELVSESGKQEQTKVRSYYQEIVERIPILITRRDCAESEEEFDITFRKIEELNNNDRIIQQLNILNSTGKLWNERQLMILEFPKIYLSEIEKLLWHGWYTACFVGDYHNSSMWAHYGDKHEGACLIIESGHIGTLIALQLYRMADEGKRPTMPRTIVPFFRVDYANKPAEVDFFLSIGMITAEEVMKLWYTDEDGNVSKCAARLQDDNGTFNWRDTYWHNFYRDITAKTKDWKYEQECRLILESMLDEYDEKKNRTLAYDFNSLKGIIFGINTSDQDKLRIIKIIQNKWEKYDRTDFKFYQAYYSEETGNIRKYELPVDFS